MSKGIKITITVGILVAIIAVTAGLLIGMTDTKELRVDYGNDDVRVYRIGMNWWDSLVLKIRYGGKYALKFKDAEEKYGDSKKALLAVSADFKYVICDMEEAERDSVESKIDFIGGKDSPFNYQLGEEGRHITKESYYKLTQALDNCIIAENVLEYDAIDDIDMMKSLTEKRGEYVTGYASSSANRKHNIALASSAVNGTVVKPGEEFSFNMRVGKRDKESGYLKAKTMFDGDYVEDYGGGVCQVSTTLYNAWVLSGLDVKYAKAHSMRVGYVPLSRDAMVSESNDLILINNSESNIYVSMYCDNDRVFAVVYGMGNDKRYDIVSEMYARTECVTEVIDESGGGAYEEIVVKEGSQGYKSKGYLIEYDSEGKEVSRELLREDVYRGHKRIVKKVPYGTAES